MTQASDSHKSLVISYMNLRKAVGFIGMALPLILILGKIGMEGGGLLNSISGYYHSGMRDVFVGSLCAIAIFLFSYHGYDWRDDLAGTLASFAALGVALFPTTPGLTATPRETTIGWIHLIFAAIFFAIMAYFSLVLFTKSSKAVQTPEKLKRNRIYIICGGTIVACIVLMFFLTFVPTESPIRAIKPVLLLETIAVEAFGFSWLVKGEAILKDDE